MLFAWSSTLLVLGAAAILIGFLIHRGWHMLSPALFFGDTPWWQALTGLRPVFDGLWPALAGTLALMNMALGPSGSGKTTLLRAVNRLNETFSGCVTRCAVHLHLRQGVVNAYDPDLPLPELRRTVGMVFQHPNVLPFSIQKNFTLPLAITLNLKPQDMADQMQQALEVVWLWDEVKDRLGASAQTLSGGQQQRLCLARALALEPEILLLDEPTASLDFKSTRHIEALLNNLKRDYTILAVTHSLGQMRRLADRVVVLNEGALVRDLSRAELVADTNCENLLMDAF